MGFNVGPRVLRATGGSISREGNFVVHQFPPQHVTDGLVGFIDPQNHDSYDESRKLTINDISGAGIIGPGTLNSSNWATSGAGKNWKHDKGGYWRFDGNMSCNWSGSSTMPILREHTIEMWIKITDNGAGGYHVFFQKDGGYSGGMVYGLRASNSRKLQSHIYYDDTNMTTSQDSDFELTNNQWYHVAVTYDSNFLLKIYVDGVDRSDTGNKTGIGTQFPRPVTGGGNLGTGDTRYCHADIGLWRLYNRALSATEIAQNYKAEKVRFYPYSDTFTPTCAGEKGKVEALVVAGGGGGGATGGGGGGGGLIFNNSVTVTTNTGVNVLVGAGGTGGAVGGQNNGLQGGNSSFGTIVATGGGYGGGGTKDGGDGGSGGGGGRDSTSYNDLSSGVSGQGNAGGGSYDNSASAGGGGGGAGSAGGNGSIGGAGDTSSEGLYGGVGGSGLAYSITGETKFYSAGGAGGQYKGGSIPQGGNSLGGSGGMFELGGNSGESRTGGNGIPDTGSGGGGGGGTNGGTHDPAAEGGAGGNGTVIVRYPAEDYDSECLLVAGGGSGGAGSAYAYTGGGGGAGGVLYFSSLKISAGKNYIVNVGKGGPGTGSANYIPSYTVGGRQGNSGTNSSFGDNVALGGGAGGGGLTSGTYESNGAAGGSGGGGGGRNTNGAKGTAGQGHDGVGSSNHGDTTTYGGGGGGAGGPALYTGSNVIRSPGGDGIYNSITGSAVLYSQGGNAGGVSSGNNYYKADPTALGSGGRGAVGNGGAGGPGYNGIVIIAYKGPQRGTGGTIDTTSRPGYTLHKFTTPGPHTFIG